MDENTPQNGIKLPQLPFLTREMLEFGNSTQLDIEVVALSNITTPISIVGATRSGLIKFPFAHTGGGSEETAVFGIPDIPVFLTAFTTSSSMERGEFYASIYLRMNGERVFKFFGGYISRQSSMSWPANNSESERQGGGKFKRVQGANPAAGAECEITVPTDEIWIIKGFQVQFVTDANAANRRVHLVLEPFGAATPLNIFGSVDQAANTTRNYTFAPFPVLSDEEDDDDILVAMPPDLIVTDGLTIQTDTTNLQVGDNFALPNIWVEQYMAD